MLQLTDKYWGPVILGIQKANSKTVICSYGTIEHFWGIIGLHYYLLIFSLSVLLGRTVGQVVKALHS